MSDHVNTTPGFGEVRATFDSSAQMQDAVTRLSLSGFHRSDISLPAGGAADDGAYAQPAFTQEDAQQMRTLGASTVATAAAIAAAGVTVATGGAAAPALAAAVLAGGVFGGATFAAQGAANASEQHARDQRAATGALVLRVRTPSAEKHADAEALLRAAGGSNIETI